MLWRNCYLMARDLGSYFMENCDQDYYAQNSPRWGAGSYLYGSILVSKKRVLAGYSIKFSFNWRRWFLWRPVVEWRFCKHVHWLWFGINLEPSFIEVPYMVLADHLDPDFKPVSAKAWKRHRKEAGVVSDKCQ